MKESNRGKAYERMTLRMTKGRIRKKTKGKQKEKHELMKEEQKTKE